MSLFLRTTDGEGRANYNNFQWPLKVGATVTAPDWNPAPVCGRGLHGLLNGLGIGGYLSFHSDAIWWIVEADNAVDLNGKHKFQSCRVVAFGPRREITAALYEMVPGPIHGLDLTAGDRSSLVAGDRSTLTAGGQSTLSAGDWSRLAAGDWSKLTGGRRSTLSAGGWSTLLAGEQSRLTAGDWSTLTAQEKSTLTAGDCSLLTAWSGSTLTGGDKSTLVFLRWIDGRQRVLTAYVGENGIKPGVAYCANADHTAVVRAMG